MSQTIAALRAILNVALRSIEQVESTELLLFSELGCIKAGHAALLKGDPDKLANTLVTLTSLALVEATLEAMFERKSTDIEHLRAAIQSHFFTRGATLLKKVEVIYDTGSR